MNCPTCGSLNKGSSLICVACGHSLETLKSAIGTPLQSAKPHRLMIFIDAANIERQARDIGIMRVPWHLIRDQLRGEDTLLGAFYYTGTDLRVEGFRQQLDYLVTHGFRVVHKRSKELPGGGYKGNLDIEMSLDMLDFVGFYDKAFALTGDGDFIPVFSRLRDRGVQVMVGNFGVGSDPGLKLVADGYIDLGLLLSLVIEHEKLRTEQAHFDQPELPLGETLDTHVDRNMLAARLYSLGRNAFDRNELSRALNHFSQAVRLMPRQMRYRHRMALCLAALGRFTDAASELEDLVRQQDDDAEVFYDLGQVYERLGAPEKALEAYTRCGNLDSRYKDVQARKQELERATKSSNGQTTRGEDAARPRGRGTRSRQTSTPTRQPRASTGSARTESRPAPARAESREEPARTETRAEPERAESQAAPETAARVGGARKRTQPEPRKERDAKAAEQPAAELSSAAAGMAQAFQHMLNGNHKDSLAVLEQAARQEPENLDVALACAQQLALSGEHTRAAMMAEQLVLDNPQNYAPVAVLGRICYERGKFADALEQFTHALELAKGADGAQAQAFLYRMLVWTHLETGNETEALAAGEAGCAVAPDDQQLRRLVDRVKGPTQQADSADSSADGEPPETGVREVTAPETADIEPAEQAAAAAAGASTE